MKSTGIVRKLDELGRVTLPKELRRTMEIGDRCPVEIYTEDGNKIVLRKYNGVDKCEFCENTNNLVPFKDKHICPDCKAELTK